MIYLFIAIWGCPEAVRDITYTWLVEGPEYVYQSLDYHIPTPKSEGYIVTLGLQFFFLCFTVYDIRVGVIMLHTSFIVKNYCKTGVLSY